MDEQGGVAAPDTDLFGGLNAHADSTVGLHPALKKEEPDVPEAVPVDNISFISSPDQQLSPNPVQQGLDLAQQQVKQQNVRNEGISLLQQQIQQPLSPPTQSQTSILQQQLAAAQTHIKTESTTCSTTANLTLLLLQQLQRQQQQLQQQQQQQQPQTVSLSTSPLAQQLAAALPLTPPVSPPQQPAPATTQIKLTPAQQVQLAAQLQKQQAPATQPRKIIVQQVPAAPAIQTTNTQPQQIIITQQPSQPQNLVAQQIQQVSKFSNAIIYICLSRHSGSALDCCSTDRTIDPALGA